MRCQEVFEFFAATLLAAASVFAEPISGRAFTLRVVDARTGIGVHGVRITTDNGIVCYTLLDGSAGFNESSLMGRIVRFTVQDLRLQSNTLDTTLDVRRCGSATSVGSIL